MTLSASERLENIDLALRLMLDRVGDKGCEHVFIEPDTPAFAAVFPTTWRELLRQRLVKPSTPRYYLLSGEGWLRAMELTERLDEEFDRKIGDLCAFLKRKVESGRREKGLTELSEIARSTGLSAGWVFNAIDSHVLATRYNVVEAYWLPGDSMKNCVEIPPDFGMNRLE